MTRLHPFHLAFALLTCSLNISGALAQQPAEGQAADPASVIEAAPRELSDPIIQKRIEDIYAQVDTLANVGVSVSLQLAPALSDSRTEFSAPPSIPAAVPT